MSYEKQTRVKPDLPQGDYTVVARLSDFAGSAYNSAHGQFLGDALGVTPHAVEVEDGEMFVALQTEAASIEKVIQQTASPLHRSLARLALDPEIVAFVVPTSQLSPDRPLASSFNYLSQDVSLELRDELDNLRLTPPDDADIYFEIEHLADF